MSKATRLGTACSALAVTGGVFAAASACTPPVKTTACQQVNGIPASENVSSMVRQGGTTCTVARQLAGLALRKYFGHSFKTTNWNCTSTHVIPQGYPYWSYVCTAHPKQLVTFRYSQ